MSCRPRSGGGESGSCDNPGPKEDRREEVLVAELVVERDVTIACAHRKSASAEWCKTHQSRTRLAVEHQR